MSVGDDLDLPINAPGTVVTLQGTHQTFLEESVVALRRPFAFQIADTNVERLSCWRIYIGLGITFLTNETRQLDKRAGERRTRTVACGRT